MGEDDEEVFENLEEYYKKRREEGKEWARAVPSPGGFTPGYPTREAARERVYPRDVIPGDWTVNYEDLVRDTVERHRQTMKIINTTPFHQYTFGLD